MENPKGDLIERLQRDGRSTPTYRTRSSGPDHEPLFESDVVVEGQVLGSGSGNSKRDAERQAAEAALAALDVGEPLGFDGPWPLFESVLAASIAAASDRTDPKLKGESAIDQVQALALRLYKGVLADLGEVVEVDDDR